MLKIPNNIIDEIVQRNDIVNIISEYVKLEKKGKNYFGLCPFHNEKTPSFSVSPEKQIFHCFSCGEGGNIVNFLSKIDNISYEESLKKLANRVNMKINEFFADNKSVEEAKYYEINKFVSDYYQFALMNTNEGKVAIEYLQNRNISLDSIKKFKIGLAPDSVNSLYQALKSNAFSELIMLELGHVTKHNNKFYDKFKNRIMFPITDENGNIVGFSGRIYLKDQNNEPKYINTQETPVFKKSSIIYNLGNAKKNIKHNNKVFLFEGFMDVISSVNSGLNESVASMGTALTDSHVTLLKRYTNNFVLCYDGDNAGIEATKRAIDILNKHNVNIFVVQLPEGLDPDDYIKKYGSEKYLEFVYNRQKSLKEYQYDEYFKNVNFNNITTIEDFKKKVFQLIAYSTGTEKELFINKLSNDIKVSVSTLKFDFSNYTKYTTKNIISEEDIKNQEKEFRIIERNRPSSKKLNLALKQLFYLFFIDRKYLIIFESVGIRIPNDDFKNLYYLVEDYYKLYDKFDEENFVQKYVANHEKYYEFFIGLYNDYKKEKKENYDENILNQCIAVIKKELTAQYTATLMKQIKVAPSDDEKSLLSNQCLENWRIIKTNNNE